jgi:hypothetical protein
MARNETTGRVEKKAKRDPNKHKIHILAGVVVVFVALLCAGGLYVGSRRVEVEIRFDDGPLGVSYKGNKIITMKDDGQSAAKGIRVGWRFLSIQGTAVPNDEKVGHCRRLRRRRRRDWWPCDAGDPAGPPGRQPLATAARHLQRARA